jgi:hypothetical protein
MTELVCRKSTRSGTNGDCVEVAMTADTTAVRDSKNPHGGHFAVSATRWQSFLAQIKASRHDG